MKKKVKDTEYFSKRFHGKDEKNVYSDRVLTIPNLMTLSRIVALPVLLWFLSHMEIYGPMPSMIIGVYMLLSDVFDGLLAKALKQISFVGALMDPVVDKLVINSVAIVLAFEGYVPVWAVVPIFIRDLGILVFGLRILVDYETLVTPTIFGRVTPLAWVCTFAISLMGLETAKWILLGISIILTLISGGIYFIRYRDLLIIKKQS
ncbi:CDP-alcohol phosphatidyltransferase family protein [bacterium]|nr:CDP-alcohol phosphatidyltransferase family protein [bacterium]